MSLQKKVLVSKLPPKPPGLDSRLLKGRSGPRNRDYTPIHFSNYFTTKFEVSIGKEEKGTNVFCVYEVGSGPGPFIFMLHGGGFSGLTWALTSQVLVGLVQCTIFAIDLRGHGNTTTTDDSDLSAETMSNDIIDVIENIVRSRDTPNVDVILVGHSMGGALAVHAALQERPIGFLAGICVIDVVEGTALEALSSMQCFLRSRPSKFNSLEQAIEWGVRSAQIRNTESARVSMPGQLSNSLTGSCAASEVSSNVEAEKCEPKSPEKRNNLEGLAAENRIEEEDGTEDSDDFKPPEAKVFKSPSSETTSSYTWRIDLAKTEQFWRGWFEGLSSKFLSVPSAKLLLLAGVDRLDRDLTVGQMQGKFQMQVLPQAGHAVHEDVPHPVAEVIASFLVRNKFATPLNSFIPAMPGC